MSLSGVELEILTQAGSVADSVQRQQAVGIVLAKSGADADQARGLLTEGFLAQTQPSFHLIPRGEAMADEARFTAAYTTLARRTADFTTITGESLRSALEDDPSTLAPLRMILGLTHNELAVAVRLVQPDARASGNSIKNFERRPAPERSSASRQRLIATIASTVLAVMNRDVLQVPDAATEYFHSKLDKRDTIDGWASVQRDAGGVPYSALLYQRYVGGTWRQVQDAYSEVKGDAVLEYPLRDLLLKNGVPHHHTKPGASGASETAEKYGMSPGPDFVIPDQAPTLVIESKVGEDGGTVRDKAARIKTMCTAASAMGLKPCALVDGKGWSERPAALLDVIIATQGRTYSLTTLDHVLLLPEVTSVIGTATAEHGDP